VRKVFKKFVDFKLQQLVEKEAANYEQLKVRIEKPPERRSKNDIDALTFFLQNLQVFKRLSLA
jgi:hypothetical protein